jgi:hypothetical protein
MLVNLRIQVDGDLSCAVDRVKELAATGAEVDDGAVRRDPGAEQDVDEHVPELLPAGLIRVSEARAVELAYGLGLGRGIEVDPRRVSTVRVAPVPPCC